jgi:hypothetical protein
MYASASAKTLGLSQSGGAHSRELAPHPRPHSGLAVRENDAGVVETAVGKGEVVVVHADQRRNWVVGKSLSPEQPQDGNGEDARDPDPESGDAPHNTSDRSTKER